MSFEITSHLANRLVRIEPLQVDDFESLYAVASDPLIWEQHPNRLRYQRDVFEVYFKGAVDSASAYRVIDPTDGALIGCSRFYDLQAAQRTVSIGYTFLARRAWGTQINRALKTLMLDHAFCHVEHVLFEVGVDNRRSRKAMEKLGGRAIGEAVVAYYGEPGRPNVIYQIDRTDWQVSTARFAG